MTQPRDQTLGDKLVAAFFGINRSLSRTQDDYALVPPRPLEDPMTTTDPAARTADPDTSHAAAASVRGYENLRSRLYTLLVNYPGGLTHEQIVTAYAGYVTAQGWRPATDQGIRSRVKELEREGKVYRSQRAQDRTANGRMTHRWFAVTDPAEQERLAEGQDPAVSRRAPRELTEEQAELSATDLLSSDIRAARSAGAFTAAEIAEKLVGIGWHL